MNRRYDENDGIKSYQNLSGGTFVKGENMKKILLVLLCFLSFNISYASDNNDTAVAVNKFKKAVKTDNPKIIADYVEYPFERRNPLPDIENEEEFIKNYEMVLDDELKQAINNSKLEDWESVGWRGIMLYSGMLWINEKGKLVAVNYKTAKELDYAKKWEQKDKQTIYEPLRQYDKKLYIFKTDTKYGRIDQINTGDDYRSQYRLALWDKNGNMAVKPEVLVGDGNVEYQGSAHNTEYHFKSGEYEYIFFVNYVGPADMVPYELRIYKNAAEIDYDNAILSEEAHIIK